jgi:hypothetical protein
LLRHYVTSSSSSSTGTQLALPGRRTRRCGRHLTPADVTLISIAAVYQEIELARDGSSSIPGLPSASDSWLASTLHKSPDYHLYLSTVRSSYRLVDSRILSKVCLTERDHTKSQRQLFLYFFPAGLQEYLHLIINTRHSFIYFMDILQTTEHTPHTGISDGLPLKVTVT